MDKHGIEYPVGIGLSRGDADSVGAWWKDEKGHLQPAEFILKKSGEVMFSSYSDGPVGRMDPDNTLELIKMMQDD